MQIGRLGLVHRAALPAALRLPVTVLGSRRGSKPITVRAYQAAAPVQAPPRQRPIYANFSLYKGKAAASFRVPYWSQMASWEEYRM